MATVQGFYEKLLQSYVGGDIPIPEGLGSVSLQGHASVNQTLAKMHRWLRILDLAITPAMLRRAFSDDVDPEIAEAILRYFTRKREPSEVNRDKADLVATFLYRHPRVPGQWEKRGFGLDGSLPLSPFEIALIEILAESDLPSLPEEHAQLLRLFDPLQEQAHKCRDLNALLESGIISQVREIKQSLDSSFFHPGVLATIAPYNAAFGRIFDRLFHTAAGEIKSYAQALQEQGGSILGNVDGVDVTVEHVAAMEETDLLNMDYGKALDKFRRVSKLKQALDRRPPVRRKPQLLKTPLRPPAAKQPPQRAMLDLPALRAAITPQQISSEENKLRKVEESIRVFVRVADPKFRQIVPMRFFNLTLTPQEADAYCAEDLNQKGPRADIGRILLRSVALFARMNTELEELKRADNSPTVWKLHADSLLVLLEIGRMLNETAARIGATAASAHGSSEFDAASMKGSLDKLRQCAENAVRQLTRNPAEKAMAAHAGAD